MPGCCGTPKRGLLLGLGQRKVARSPTGCSRQAMRMLMFHTVLQSRAGLSRTLAVLRSAVDPCVARQQTGLFVWWPAGAPAASQGVSELSVLPAVSWYPKVRHVTGRAPAGHECNALPLDVIVNSHAVAFTSQQARARLGVIVPAS
jgi:hypothetical protein